jgi:hypothetical protein
MAREMTAEVRDEMIRMRNRHQGCRKAQLAAIRENANILSATLSTITRRM